jgi:hypothetical protein
MKSIWNLTTLCVVAASLLPDVLGSSTLQNPCIMQEIEMTLDEDSVEETSMYVCELQGEDSELVEGGVCGSDLTVEIKPEDVVVLLAQMENTTNLDHGVTIYAQGLTIDSDNKLSFPQGVVIEFGMDDNGDSSDGNARRLGDRDGSHSVLVIRVLASNTVVQHSADVLSNKVFGTNGDPSNLSERFRSCSYDQLLMEPTDNSLATNGVAEITLATDITYGVTKSEDVVNAVKTQLGKDLGALVGGPDLTVRSIKSIFRHVIMCLPTGTVLSSPNW